MALAQRYGFWHTTPKRVDFQLHPDPHPARPLFTQRMRGAGQLKHLALAGLSCLIAAPARTRN
jgi:hypothetical protein